MRLFTQRTKSLKMKSNLPRPIVELAKKIVIPVLRNKWKKDPKVAEWVQKGYIDDKEIDGIVLNWYIHKKPVPGPHKVKQLTISELGKEYGCEYLVETGTYRGDMLEAQKKNFKKLFSIELSMDFWEDAKKRFKNDSHINLLQGDSGAVLPQLTPTLDKPTLFWLDGHYCGGVTALSDIECPIYAELDAVFDNNNNHVILIDDARDFVGQRDYPTIKELSDYVKKKAPNYHVSVQDDMIRVLFDKK
jgi:hypothetical protein